MKKTAKRSKSRTLTIGHCTVDASAGAGASPENQVLPTEGANRKRGESCVRGFTERNRRSEAPAFPREPDNRFLIQCCTR